MPAGCGSTGDSFSRNSAAIQDSPRLALIAFEPSVFLPTKARAEELGTTPEGSPSPPPEPLTDMGPEPEPGTGAGRCKGRAQAFGHHPATSLEPAWRRNPAQAVVRGDLSADIDFSVSFDSQFVQNLEAELKQILDDLGGVDRLRVERSWQTVAISVCWQLYKQ